MKVRFKKSYSDVSGSYRGGWERHVPDDLAKQLINSGTAEAVVTPPADNAPPAGQTGKTTQPTTNSTATGGGTAAPATDTRRPGRKKKTDVTPPADNAPPAAEDAPDDQPKT